MGIGRGGGTRARARSSCRSPRFARAATSRRSCNRASAPSRRSSVWSSRRMCRRLDTPRRSARREPRPADQQVGSQSDRGLLDEQVQAFRERPLEGRYPYLFVDAKVEKVRAGGRVARKCVVIAHAVHESGRREIIGLDVGEAETEAFWREFLRSLVARAGRRSVGDQRRAPRPEGGAGAGPRRPLAAVLGALPQRLSRARAQGPARLLAA